MPEKAQLVVDGKTLAVSNLHKVLYPKPGFTKAQVIDYYIRIAPVLLPHLKDRPLTMKRYPDGVEGQFFYEKNCPVHRPKWVQTAKVWSEGNQRIMHYCLANDLPTLVWAANLADLELNTSVTYDQTKGLSRSLAQRLESDHLDRVTSNMSKAVRKGKVFVDWSQNDEHKTTICVYSLRAKEEPTVSTPVTWTEVENCLKKKRAELLRFRSDQTLARVEKQGDLFKSVETLKQRLPKKWDV